MARSPYPNMNGEPKNSKLKWELVDGETAKKLAAAINNDGFIMRRKKVFIPLFVILLSIFPIGFLVYVLFLCVKILMSETIIPVIIIYLIVTLVACILLGTLLRQFIKAIPYIYPERQPQIWIFRTKCYRAGLAVSSPMSDHRSAPMPLAFFNSKSGQITITLSRRDYKANPVGKEYIFYKFNNRQGNRWMAIASSKLDEL